MHLEQPRTRSRSSGVDSVELDASRRPGSTTSIRHNSRSGPHRRVVRYDLEVPSRAEACATARVDGGLDLFEKYDALRDVPGDPLTCR